ncbi:hypothetical protein [Streptomyces mirabilis]|uniref:hypothetical protein n=1 Tax=Streptomyces mirabilis TaxID=68239 RepID=UPI0036CEF319
MPLHGLADNRTSFPRSAAEPTRRYRVVLPDLPGHGTDAANPSPDCTSAGTFRRCTASVSLGE